MSGEVLGFFVRLFFLRVHNDIFYSWLKEKD